MNRIFQHYKGLVEEFSGKSISSFLSIDDEIDGDVYLLWLENKDTGFWYRIFIDGCYCGIDEYPECGIEDDTDDEVIVVDHYSKLKSGMIKCASVKDSDGENRHIILNIKFPEQTIEYICESEEGKNKLQFLAYRDRNGHY